MINCPVQIVKSCSHPMTHLSEDSVLIVFGPATVIIPPFLSCLWLLKTVMHICLSACHICIYETLCQLVFLYNVAADMFIYIFIYIPIIYIPIMFHIYPLDKSYSFFSFIELRQLSFYICVNLCCSYFQAVP